VDVEFEEFLVEGFETDEAGKRGQSCSTDDRQSQSSNKKQEGSAMELTLKGRSDSVKE